MRATRCLTLIALAACAGCGGKEEPDAFGNFEATEVVVSSQAGGQLTRFTPVEGATLPAGAHVAEVDTTQLGLERAQTAAQRAATEARVSAAGGQVAVFESQIGVARRTLERTQRLAAQHAATAQQLDQAERDYRMLVAQAAAAREQRASVVKEVAATTAHEAQVRDRILKSRITNPVAGTVLATYAKAGELVQAGQPLYRIADLDTMVLRAYVVESQLASVRLGARVTVNVDRGGGVASHPGVVSWVSPKAEFTPTPVQTRDERASLVYAVKVLVANPRGELKIGMPADLAITRPAGGA